MTASARCPHQVIWYRLCHWCEAEANEAYWKADFADRHQFTFWRRTPPHTYEAEMKYAAARALRRLMRASYE